jgi:hypothetical protein
VYVHTLLQIVLEALQRHAQHPSLLTLGLQQNVFSYVLVEIKLFSQMFLNVDICYQRGSIPLYSYDH